MWRVKRGGIPADHATMQSALRSIPALTASTAGRARRRVRSAVALASASVLTVVATATAGAAGPPTATPAVATIPEAPDYASELLGNPWDFADSADGRRVEQGSASAGPGWATPSGGQITVHAAAGTSSKLNMVDYQPGALPTDRDGRFRPVDAGRFTRYSFRANASADAVAMITWYRTCGATECVGDRLLSGGLKAGWNTYSVDLAPDADWTGDIVKLSLRVTAPGGSPLVVDLDWVRVHEPGPDVNVDISDAFADEVQWERVGVSPAPGSDTLAFGVADGGSTPFPASWYPPGTYDFRARNGGTWGSWGSDLVIDAQPRPFVTDPDLAGGDDWATSVRGNAWDMSQSTDISKVTRAALSFSGGVAHGSSLSPPSSDPNTYPALSGKKVNARRWHRLTVQGEYFGSFLPIGGMVGRWFWNPAGNVDDDQTSQDFLLWLDTGGLSFDLVTNPLTAVNEPGSTPKLGWGGPSTPWVDTLRWDPHEDSGARSWDIDRIRLARNDRTNPGFTFRWSDSAYQAGTTADLWLVPSMGATAGGMLLASGLSVTGTTSTFVWDGDWRAMGLEPGSWYLRVIQTDPAGNTTSAWSSGPVDVGGRATFVDVIPGSSFFDEIDWLVAHEIATGEPDYFRPTSAVSRQAMAAFLYRAAGSPPGPFAAPSFTDLSPGDAFYTEISWLVDSGIATGYADGGFHPLDSVSRQAMAAFLMRAKGAAPGAPDPGFPDVPPAHQFFDEIAWLIDVGIATGYADGLFHPTDPVTRQAMAAFLERADAVP